MLHDKNDISWMPIGEPSLKARLMIDTITMIRLVELAWNANAADLHSVVVTAIAGRPLQAMLHAAGGRRLQKDGARIALSLEVAEPLLASAVSLLVDDARHGAPFKLSRIIGRFPSVETREHLYRLPCFADDLVNDHVRSVQHEEFQASRLLRFQVVEGRVEAAWCGIEMLELPRAMPCDTSVPMTEGRP